MTPVPAERRIRAAAPRRRAPPVPPPPHRRAPAPRHAPNVSPAPTGAAGCSCGVDAGGRERDGRWRARAGRTPLALARSGARHASRVTVEPPRLSCRSSGASTLTRAIVRRDRSRSRSTPGCARQPRRRPAPVAPTTGEPASSSRGRPARRSTIDGRPAGMTPLTIASVARAGTRFVIERTGYRPWTTTVDVKAGERARVAASLVGGTGQE